MNETHDLAGFREKFQVPRLLIVETRAWTWSVRPQQVSLGCGVISLNRHAATLGEVSPVEFADLAGLITVSEQALRAEFGPKIMNYLMLMMVDHHVHYHVIPRYDEHRDFAGLQWQDTGWPGLPVLSDIQHETEGEILETIRDQLKAAVRRT